MAKESKFAGFTLTVEDVAKLRKLSERYDGNISMTVRILIRDAFDEKQLEGN